MCLMAHVSHGPCLTTLALYKADVLWRSSQPQNAKKSHHAVAIAEPNGTAWVQPTAGKKHVRDILNFDPHVLSIDKYLYIYI